MILRPVSITPFILVGSLSMLLFSSCENDIAKVKLITSQDHLPVESAKNIRILYSDSARVQVQITSPLMNRYNTKGTYLEMPRGVKLLFFAEQGPADTTNVRSRLTANYAIRYEKERKMEARNNVVVINDKGEQLNTEHLVWDEVQEKIYSEGFVKITTPEEIIYGQGFESNQNFTKYKIFNIKGTISLNKKP